MDQRRRAGELEGLEFNDDTIWVDSEQKFQFGQDQEP
jgi:hypothetical protein